MINDFFNTKVKGPTKELSIADVIYIALGGRIYLSKRLAPAMSICNARIYAGDQFVYSGDLEIPKVVSKLECIAQEFGVVLDIYYEHGDKVYWSSKDPNTWNGYWVTDDGVEVSSSSIHDALPWYIREAARRQRQWGIDHGLLRRNLKEWWSDFYYYRVKCKIYDIQRWWRKRNEVDSQAE